MERGPTSSFARGAQWVLAVAFVLALAAPAVLTWTHPRPASELDREFRRPAPWPAKPVSLATAEVWPRMFDAWFADHFGLRSTLIRGHNALKLLALGESPTSEIVVGPQHWMFTTRDRAVEVYRGADPFTERELELWARVLSDRRAWCEARGVRYVFAIAPNKETIYPDRWPARLDKVGPTRREQLVEFVRGRSDVPLLDLTAALELARRDFASEGDVYFQLGTHWNDRGALYAYRALLEHAALELPELAARRRDEFTFEPTDFQDDSWARRLYLEDVLVQPNVEVRMLFERGVEEAFWEQARVERRMAIDSEHPNATLPRAVVFHDSMGEKLRPLLAEHFSRASFRWVSDFDTELIEREKPAIVIQLFVERALSAFSLSTSPLDTPERCAAEFAASTQVLARGLDGLAADRSDARGPIELERRADGTLLVRYGGGGMLVPAFEVPPGTWPVLRLEFDSPADSSLLVEFMTPRYRDYARLARGVQRPVKAGANVVHLKLRVPQLSGRLRLHPGLAGGEYVLRDLEVRAVPE
jgi:alginate O-acetyltransferase complex protein AlgJ